MPDLEKSEKKYTHKNFVTLATKFLQIIHFVSISNLIEIKQYQIFVTQS